MSSKRIIIVSIFCSVLLVMSALVIVQYQPVYAITETVLALDDIADVLQADDITVTGTLVNATSGEGIANANISFSGTGGSNLVDVSTDINGDFIAIGASPSSAFEEWMVQAHFAGNGSYALSDSNIVTFDTIAQFAVPLGASIVNLTDFGTLVEFDDVITEGTLTVTNCDTPASERYLSLDKCLKMSTNASLASDTFAHIQMSLDALTIPDGYSAANADVFMIEPETLDITESRDLIDNTSTGRITEISRFILGIALHAEKPANAARQEILVGNGNEVSIRDIGNTNNVTATVSLSQTVYHIGDNVTVTVEDAEANLDSTAINTVLVGIASTTDPVGIIVEIEETGDNTSIFEGVVELIQEPSSGNMLSASIGDNITAYYEGSYGRLHAIIDDVGEPGMAELSDYEIDEGEIFSIITPVGGAVDLKFVDAQLGSSGRMTITMSFANAATGAAGLPDLKLIQRIQIDEFTIDYLDITIPDGIDGPARTITGETDSVGQFFIASCGPPAPDCGPGGGGGGPFIPKGGLVLDSQSASVEGSSNDQEQERPSHKSGGGGGRSGSTSIEQTPSGQDVEIATEVGSETVTITFESLESSGQVKVESRDIKDLEEIFDELTEDGQQGIVYLENAEYSTAGTIFDIDASNLDFSGPVEVTIPYDESLIEDESNVRLLHYDEEHGEWKDVTIDVNEDENRVRGILDSFSPVIATEVNDGTFGPVYFGKNPLSKITTSGSILSEIRTGEYLAIPTLIKNVQREDQTYTLLVQIIDQNGMTSDINWQIGSLARGQSNEIVNNWIPEERGTYTIQIFIWDNIDSPSPLSSVTVKQVKVI